MNDRFLSLIDEKKALLDEISDYLWDHPETAFTETGFRRPGSVPRCGRRVLPSRKTLPGSPPLFRILRQRRPVIGFLGEFDALSGLSQQSGVTHRASAGGICGHGCGHNLLGVGALGAAFAVKRYLEESGAPGTVIYFGCPGEEGGSGKGFMARDGVFDGLDAALTWHPEDHTYVRTNLSLANCQVLFQFDGLASHAGKQPDLGRSALDAVELMNVGVQFLREHIPSSSRIHYAITDAGGFSPNVVQSHAEVLYLIRGVDNKTVKEHYGRVCDIAKGAALMTGTQESHTFIKACSNTVPNTVIQRVLQEKMERYAPPAPTEEDLAFAAAMTDEALRPYPDADPAHPIHWELDPYDEREPQTFSSTDVGDVSWVCPTAQISTATVARGTPGHSWQLVAQGKQPLAHRMTRYAARILAAAAVELLERPELLQAAEEEYRRRVGEEGYVPPIPQGVRPVSMTSFQK